MDIICASQSPSSVNLTMVDNSTSSSSSSTTTTTTTTSIQLDGSLGDGGRAIDRYNPIIRDSSRISKSLPSSPQSASLLAVSPKPQLNNNNRKSPSKTEYGTKKHSNLKPNNHKLKTKEIDENNNNNNNKIGAAKYISQAAADSTRYLLSDPSASMDYASENIDPALKFVPEEDDKYSSIIDFKTDENDTAAKSPSASRCPDQVVVLRVSLHCKGCERKMRKHLSKMQGVTSFSIDFAANKVTVKGDVTPLEVIASISKVKTIAQISTPSASMLSSSSPSPLPVN